MQRCRGKGGGGINRLNDIKEQCCDSEQLAFPSVDRPTFCVCVCTLNRDRLSCDCSFLSRAQLTGLIDDICRGKKQ